jgi:hypothetical protein
MSARPGNKLLPRSRTSDTMIQLLSVFMEAEYIGRQSTRHFSEDFSEHEHRQPKIRIHEQVMICAKCADNKLCNCPINRVYE